MNIHDLTPLVPVVKRIAHKHASLHVTPYQYAVVGRHLIQAIVDILGDAVTPQIGDAWYHGYWSLAHVSICFDGEIQLKLQMFIAAEREIYESAVEKGGWEGWREHKVVKKVQESEEVVSLYLEPKEKTDLPEFKPGQYISVSLHIPALGYRQARQ